MTEARLIPEPEREFLKKFRDPALARKMVELINEVSRRPATLMEVCGTHTVAIFRYGLRQLLPGHIRLISGPGCPVCVTPNNHIDQAIVLSRRPEVIMTTFGDMMRVPGSLGSLAEEKAAGADVRVVYSTMDALALAEASPGREVVFFGIGFETTSPTIAAAVLAARERGLGNFSVLGAQKLIPDAMRALLGHPEVKVDGFICPGHVSSILGTEPYRFIAEEYKIPAVITGFEPLDLLQGIYMLIAQVEAGKAEVEIQYKRGVPQEGNPQARALLEKVFAPCEAAWRGIGVIPNTGLKMRPEYSGFDAALKFALKPMEARENPACICGDVLRGSKTPLDCPLFGRACVPEKPVGACMVSSEGTCAAYYKYARREEVS